MVMGEKTTNPLGVYMEVIINKSQILYETGRATLVKVPHTTNDRFWLSKKMIRNNGNRYSILIPEHWKYRIISGNKVTSESVETIEYMQEHFGDQIEGTVEMQPVVEVHTPEPKSPIKREVDDELTR